MGRALHQRDLVDPALQQAGDLRPGLRPTIQLYEWVRTSLPGLNGDVLGGRRSVRDLLAVANAAIAQLGSPTHCHLDECRLQLVALGMIGSSAERHSQEAGGRPGQALSELRAGRWSFRRYVATLASRVGGPPRDSFHSYTVWNGTDVDVYLPGSGAPYLRLPGVLPTAAGPLTFSEDAGEPLFIEMMRRCVALEAAANSLLWAVCEGSLEVDGPEALDRVGAATLLLRGVRAEMNMSTTCSTCSTGPRRPSCTEPGPPARSMSCSAGGSERTWLNGCRR